jgi:hypothetical protein
MDDDVDPEGQLEEADGALEELCVAHDDGPRVVGLGERLGHDLGPDPGRVAHRDGDDAIRGAHAAPAVRTSSRPPSAATAWTRVAGSPNAPAFVTTG